MQIRECRVTCIKLVWNTGTLYELGNFFQYMTRESQIYVNILYSLCRTCLNKLTTSSKFLLHVRLTCNYNNYLCSKMQCNSSVCVTCGLPKKKREKLWPLSPQKEKRDKPLFCPSENREMTRDLTWKQNVQWDWIKKRWLTRSLRLYVITEK